MTGLLYRKLLRDLWIARGRLVMMIIAIAVGIFGVACILSAYTILSREIGRNYLGTNPASAQLEMDKIDDSLVEAVRHRPGIADAEASSVITARIEKSPGEWVPLLLFVVKDFDAMRINTFNHESGAWPPPEGSILLEKEALPLVNGKVGDSRRIQLPNVPAFNIAISGLTHDPGLAPAWQEQTAYGYTTFSTLKLFDENAAPNILKITVKNDPMDMASIERTVDELAGWLKQQGYTVHDIALVLGAVLTSTMISGLLAQQVRQIGIMKSVGARSRQAHTW